MRAIVRLLRMPPDQDVATAVNLDGMVARLQTLGRQYADVCSVRCPCHVQQATGEPYDQKVFSRKLNGPGAPIRRVPRARRSRGSPLRRR